MHPREELFYVGLRQPLQFRRTVLGCSKDVIGCLKKYEQFKDFRHRRSEQSVMVKKLFEDLNFLSMKLKNALPKAKLRPQVEPSGKSKPKKFDSHLNRIEADLAALENKLSHIK